MKKIVLVLVVLFSINQTNPTFAQSSDLLKTVLSNSWVKKYKKLKSDLEEKAYVAKSMENISESDLKSIEKSYKKTSKMLEAWVDHLVADLEKNNHQIIYKMSEGSISEDLKKELLDIFTFYANDFSTLYEEATGLKSRTIFTHSALLEDGQQALDIEAGKLKVEKNFLLANVKKPLSPTDWKTLN